MPSDQQVSARAVLEAELTLRRSGARRSLEELEQVEPDLTNYLLESLSVIHQKLLALGGPSRASQRLFLEVQHLALVCITALRRGHYELWKQSDTGSHFELDTHPPEPADSSDSPESPAD